MRGSAKNLTCWFAATVVPLHGNISSIGGGEIAEINVCTLEVEAGFSAAFGAGVGAADLEVPEEAGFEAGFDEVAEEEELSSSDESEPPQAKATIMANAISANKTVGMLEKFSLFISLYLFLIRLFCLNRTGRFTPGLFNRSSRLAQYSILEITM